MKSSGRLNGLPNYLLVHPVLDRVSNVHNRHPEWFDDPLVLSWDLSANRLLQKKEWRGAAALYSTPSGHKTTSKSNEPVDDIRRRVAMSRKGLRWMCHRRVRGWQTYRV